MKVLDSKECFYENMVINGYGRHETVLGMGHIISRFDGACTCTEYCADTEGV